MSAERKCVQCGKAQDERYKPFCSKRCADIDLGRWLSGRYAIPGTETDEDDTPPPPPSSKDRTGPQN